MSTLVLDVTFIPGSLIPVGIFNTTLHYILYIMDLF